MKGNFERRGVHGCGGLLRRVSGSEDNNGGSNVCGWPVPGHILFKNQHENDSRKSNHDVREMLVR